MSRGDHSGWSAEEAYRLHYKDNNVYQAVADFDGAMQFKLASSDGNWETQLWAQAEGSTEINGTDLAIGGVTYPVAYQGGWVRIIIKRYYQQAPIVFY